MGYALFANRKLMYSNMIFNLQMQLNQLTEERLKNMQLSANIADGSLSPEEIFTDLQNCDQYAEYILHEGAWISQEFGKFQFTDDQGNAMTPGEYYFGVSNDETERAAKEYMINILKKEYADDISEKLAVEDQKLESKMDQIETKLSVLQKNLEKVEEQEGKAIDAATPKYGGVGQ